MQKADEAYADGDRQSRQKANLLLADHVTVWRLLWMITLGWDEVCWDVCRSGYSLTCAWHVGSSRGTPSPGAITRSTPLGCSVWAFCALVWWTGSGRTLAFCPVCGLGCIRTNDVCDCGWRMTSQPTPKVNSLKKENFKPNMIRWPLQQMLSTCSHLVDASPCSSIAARPSTCSLTARNASTWPPSNAAASAWPLQCHTQLGQAL